MKLERLKETASEICRLNFHQPVLVGVSGGPDSLCLVDGLHRLGYSVIVAHFDHQLRPESDQDAAWVGGMAERLGLKFVLGQQDVAQYAREAHLSLEAAARLLRYHFLFEQARLLGAQAVAVGHHADDQVETVLMHLLRGAGLSGLSGMPFRALIPEWDSQIPLVRPLLPFYRDEILAYCAGRSLQPLLDPTNQDPIFFRNRLRHELIPYLEQFNPQVKRQIWRTAQVLAGDEEIVRHAVKQAWEGCIQAAGSDFLKLDLTAFRDLLPGLQRGVLRRAIAQLASADLNSPRDLDFNTIERALRFLNPPHAEQTSAAAAVPLGQIDLVQGLSLFVEGQTIVIAPTDSTPDVHEWPQLAGCQPGNLAVPGVFSLAGDWRLVSAWVSPEEVPPFLQGEQHGMDAWLDADRLTGPLSVRCPQAGDRFQPLGMQGRSIKLSDFWINQKLPRRARAAWPLVVSGSAVVWVPAYRLAHPFRITEHTRRVIHLRLDPHKPSD